MEALHEAIKQPSPQPVQEFTSELAGQSVPELFNEHDFYPVHEEDSVPETPPHFAQMRYLTGALQAHFSNLWVTGDTCLYWEPGNSRRYVAPDVAVIACPRPAKPENVYLRWVDPPLLFVAEIGSRSSLRKDTGPKIKTYGERLKTPEYLYCDPPKVDLRLWRMVEGRFRRTRKDEDGRVWSEQLQLWFGYDAEGFLRIITPEGEVLLTQEEERAAREAEQRLRLEAQQGLEAERRGRLEAERRLAGLEAELGRLRR